MTKQIQLDNLKKMGFIYEVCAGYQLDLNSALIAKANQFSEGHFCDHNCTTECGNYECPAAFSHNKGIMPKTLMTVGQINNALVNAREGMVLANSIFIDKYFDQYTKNYLIPPNVSANLKETLQQNKLEINLFGGNPELHPNFIALIRRAKNLGFRVTTTTTGKKFLHDQDFVTKFITDPPDLLAVSADDYASADELRRLLAMPLPDLKMYWQKANPLYGQRKKAYESIYVAKLTAQEKFCPMLFNVVVHPGNISWIIELLSLLHAHFPRVKINPYPAQASFGYEEVDWQESDLPKVEALVDYMIDKTQSTGSSISDYVPRLPYWLALKSVFQTETNRNKLLYAISGNGIWQCYRQNGAGRYLQTSCAEISQNKQFQVGGHPGCFWNALTVTNPSQQLWDMDSQKVAQHILFDKVQLAVKSNRSCPGCLMPRLMFDGISVELGLNRKYLPKYFKLRQKYLGF